MSSQGPQTTGQAPVSVAMALATLQTPVERLDSGDICASLVRNGDPCDAGAAVTQEPNIKWPIASLKQACPTGRESRMFSVKPSGL